MTVNFDEMLNKLNLHEADSNTLTSDRFIGLIREIYASFDSVNLLEETRLLMESIDKVALDAWNGIPELQLTEIAWGKATPGEKPGEVNMDARTQLEGFLKKVGVGGQADIEAKLGALQAFFSKSTAESREGTTSAVTQTSLGRAKLTSSAKDGASAKENISRIMGYLTFYKTLTRILQNFGASPAGFTFESFMAVLLGGVQVPTGNQTIADLTTGTGKPISLKLLSDAAPNVKGSLKDLINDMVGAGGATRAEEMKYLVCLKNLTGEGEEISGEIKFYQFVFNINNMLDFLTLSTGKKSVMLFQLPLSEMGEGIDLDREVVADELQPYYSEESDDEESEDQQELTSWWLDNYSDMYNARAAELGLDNSEHKASFLRFLQPNGVPGEGSGTGWQSRVEGWALENFLPDLRDAKRVHVQAAPETKVAKLTYDDLRKTYIALAKTYTEKKQTLKAQAKGGEVWASMEDSLAYLKKLSQESPDLYAQALLKTRGYITKIQWIINKSQIEAATKALGQKAYIGRLFIGVKHVAEMVNMYRDMVNGDIFEIIRELKALVFYVHKFFAEGFERPTAAKVIEASDNINEKTKTVVEEEDSDATKEDEWIVDPVQAMKNT